MTTNNLHHFCSTNSAKVLWEIRITFVSLFFICLSSCDSFTETNIPTSELNEFAVFEQKNTANAAMTDIYAKIRDNGILTGKTYGTGKILGLYTDELSWWGGDADPSKQFYSNSVQANNLVIAEWWNTAYNAIYASNAIIEGVTASTALLKSDKDQLLGEAKFVRGLLYFYLIQLYGDVPYITTTDYTVNVKVSRMPKVEIYNKIIKDLNEASELLPKNYISEGRVRPNFYAAKALLARVYLYNRNWDEAANSASAVLNNTEIYIWQEDLSNVFLKTSTTAIWQLMPRTAIRNSDDAFTFIFNSGPPPQVALSMNLVNSFESGDLRKKLWTRAITNGPNTWHHAYKYKKSSTSNPQQEYSIVLRLSEQYLIRAEARAQQGELIGAKEDLNKIRNTAGLPSTTAVSQSEIVIAILKERRVEFFTEFGHRFMDLKRAEQLDLALRNVKESWNTTDKLLPIPQNEINLNPAIAPQNPGY